MDGRHIVYDFKKQSGNIWEVAWTHWDGHCMCTREQRLGTVEFVSEDGTEPDWGDMQKLVGDKYYGNN